MRLREAADVAGALLDELLELAMGEVPRPAAQTVTAGSAGPIPAVTTTLPAGDVPYLRQR